jgi:hypothetical protein
LKKQATVGKSLCAIKLSFECFFSLYRYGLKCRFLGGHVRKNENGELRLVEDEDRKARAVFAAKEMNFIGPDVLKLLRSRKVWIFSYNFGWIFKTKCSLSILVPSAMHTYQNCKQMVERKMILRKCQPRPSRTLLQSEQATIYHS